MYAGVQGMLLPYVNAAAVMQVQVFGCVQQEKLDCVRAVGASLNERFGELPKPCVLTIVRQNYGGGDAWWLTTLRLKQISP